MIAKVSFIMHVLAFIWLVSALILILIILLQKGRGGGLSGAFGGGGMAGGLLGSKTGDFLTWVTVGLVGVFLLLSVTLAKFYKPSGITQVGNGPATQGQQAPVDTPPGEALPAESQPMDAEADVPVGTEIPVETDVDNTGADTN